MLIFMAHNRYIAEEIGNFSRETHVLNIPKIDYMQVYPLYILASNLYNFLRKKKNLQ